MQIEQIKNNQSRSINSYRTIALSFILLTLIFLGAVFYFYFNKLTIILIPSKEKISDNFIIDVHDTEKNSQQTAFQQSIPGVVEQFETEEQNIYPSSGVKNISKEIIGQVVVINNYNKNQPLIAGTRLLSHDNKLFKIKKTINVPAKSSVEVAIYADELSEEMAIEPTEFTIPGLWMGLQDKIYGKSNEKFIYSLKIKKYIQQVDVDYAINNLKEKLIAKIAKQINKDFEIYDKILYDINQNAININVEGKINEEKDEFSVIIKSTVIVVAFSDAQVKKIIQKRLQNTEFYPQQITYSLNDYNIQQGIATVSASFQGEMVLLKNIGIIDPNKIIGLTEQQLKVYLNGFNEFANYELIFSPSFRKKVPSLIDRIQIEVKSP